MKKRWSEEQTRFLTRLRQADAFKQKRRSKKAARDSQGRLRPAEVRRREQQGRRARVDAQKRRVREIVAPENFSLIGNPEEMISFFNSIEKTVTDGWRPMLVMREIKSLGPDAIAVLNSTLNALVTKYDVAITGNIPRISGLADILLRSGFFEYATPSRGMSYRRADRGMISHEHENIVDTPNAARLIHFATKMLTGKATYHQGSYTALGELMHNTFDHAAKDVTGKERWWASVYIDEEHRVAHFTFLDNGVGIFGSRPVKLLDTFRSAMNLTSDKELLRDIFQGKLASRTGIVWRGQGLPRVYQRVKNGRITEMTVLTNRVIANLDRDDFRELSVDFPGTLYHWELRA